MAAHGSIMANAAGSFDRPLKNSSTVSFPQRRMCLNQASPGRVGICDRPSRLQRGASRDPEILEFPGFRISLRSSGMTNRAIKTQPSRRKSSRIGYLSILAGACPVLRSGAGMTTKKIQRFFHQPDKILCGLARFLAYFFLIFLLTIPGAQAQITQTVEIASSPNPVGSGARAIGMGGAFIGVADDATAASWNPGGLIQLETPEISIVGAYDYRREDTTYQAFPEASGPQSVSTTEINYFSGAYPFSSWGRNMIVSLNYQHLYDFNKEVHFAYRFFDPVAPQLSLDNQVDYEQEGAWKALSPAFAVQVTPKISVGAAVNFWDSGVYDNQWKSRYRSDGSGLLGAAPGVPFDVKTHIDERYEMDGTKIDFADPLRWQNVNYHLGLMWNIDSRWTLGAVFKAPFQAHLKHDYHFSSVVQFPAPNPPQQNQIDFSEHVRLDMPMSYGLGFGLRVTDALTFDLDLYRTEWGDFVLHDEAGNKSNPITGKPADESSSDATTQIRFGGEYLLIGEKFVVPLRAGVFYDPEPAEGSPDDFFGFSLGSGVVWKNIVYDAAYQFRFGSDVRSTQVGNADSSQDVQQHTLYMSIIYHF